MTDDRARASEGGASLMGNGKQIERRHAPSLMTFQFQFLDKRQPLVMTGVVDDWPALGRW